MKEKFDALIDHLMETGFFMEQAVEVIEKGMIQRALQRTGSNQSEAAKILGIHRNTLLRKMVIHSIDGKRPRRKPVTSAKGRNQRPASRRSREAS